MRILQVVETSGFEADVPFPISALADLGHEIDRCLAASPGDEEPPASRIGRLRPDVLWIGDALRTDLRLLSAPEWSQEPSFQPWRPRLTVGWAASAPAAGTDWSGFDLILTGDPLCLEQAVRLGAGRAVRFHPACRSRPPEAERSSRRWDIVFRGAVDPKGGSGLDCLRELAKAPLGFRGECDPALFLTGSDLSDLPAGLHLYDQGERADRDLPGMMADSRMALLLRDQPPTEADPFVVAALSAGTLLLAEQGSAAEHLFEPDRDFLRFTSPAGLLDLLYGHREGGETAEAITGRAALRCAERHGAASRAAEFIALLESSMND
jgi:hypothetical protein